MGKKPKTRLIKWAGSKVQSASAVLPFLLQDRMYIEPFCGSAAFFFMGNAKHACLNDTNASLISFYEEVKNNTEKVWTIYSSLDIGEKEYYEYRSEYNKMEFGSTKAAYFLYLNHFCFNGIYRTNRRGEFNTPFGAKKKIKEKITFDEISHFAEALKFCMLSSLDFEEFLKQMAPQNSCIYMDPPYFTQDCRVFNEYGKESFKLDDLKRLLNISKWSAQRGNRVVISYRNCTEFKELFADYLVAGIKVQRNVGGFAGRRKSDTELIAVLG